jgi:hypothetical protein
MANAPSVSTAWTNTTAVTDYSGACRLDSVKVRCNPDAAAASYLMLWDSITATPGTTAPDFAVLLPASTATRTTEVNINFGGIVCATGVQSFVATAANGGTAATTSAPQRVEVRVSQGG